VSLPRGSYVLLFDYRARRTGADSFTVKLKPAGSTVETPLFTKSAAATTWKRAFIPFQVSGGDPTATTFPINLLFDELGARDSFGPYIDNVILHSGEFEVTQWDPNITQPPGPSIVELPNGTRALRYGQKADGSATFELTASLKMKALPISAVDADRIARDWEVTMLQNIVEQPIVWTDSYELGNDKGESATKVKNLPCQDPNGSKEATGGFDVKPFVQASDILTVEHTDSPGNGFHGIKYGGTVIPFLNLVNTVHEVSFVTWVYVESKTTHTKQFLKWVRWKVQFNINVDAFAVPPVVNDHMFKYIEKIDEGNGDGPLKPSFLPREIIQERNPK